MRPTQLFTTLFAVTAAIATPIQDSTTNWELVADEIATKYGIEVADEPADKLVARDTSCYSSGVRWENPGQQFNALDNAGQFCAQVNPGGYRPDQTKYRCYQWWQGNNIRRNVIGLQNLQGRTIELSVPACFSFFRGLINACPSFGGTNSNGAWWWRVDPNAGGC